MLVRTFVAALFCLAAGVALSACGGGGGGGGGTAAAAGNSSFQAQMVHVIKSVEPQVVQIETPSGLGSGVVFDDHGDVVTNAHVVGSSRRFRVTAADGHRYRATLVGVFGPDDLAVVRADGAHLKPARFADSRKLAVGDVALAIGNPLGLRSSVTNGIVSALGRTVSEPSGAALPNAIQTSAAINPGNSGGALVDLAGEVIGIPTLAATDPELGGAAPGIGFAIPSDVVKDIAGQLVAHGRVVNSHRAFLGVELAAVGQSRGAVVAAVQRGGPADKAGIGPGAVILSIAGTPVSSPADVAAVLTKHQPGETVKLRVVGQGGGQARDVSVKLGQLPG